MAREIHFNIMTDKHENERSNLLSVNHDIESRLTQELARY